MAENDTYMHFKLQWHNPQKAIADATFSTSEGYIQ